MNGAKKRNSVSAAAALVTTAALGGCAGGGDTGSAGGVENAKVAFLMPDRASTRYDLADKPLFEARMKRLCPSCTVIYHNAEADDATQQRQARSTLAEGVKALVLDPVDSAAAGVIVKWAQARGVPVIAYDRLVTSVPADYYVSFDNEKIGAMIAQSLVDHLKQRGALGGLLQVNGSPKDSAAAQLRKGVNDVIGPSGFRRLAEYDTPGWRPEKAQSWVSLQIPRFGDKIAGVVAANDGTGGGAIAAFKKAGVRVPPVTGNDAELDAAQRIIAGEQYNTISKPIKVVAEASANVAYEFMRGERPPGMTMLYETPAELFVPTVVTRKNINEVLFRSGIMKASDACTGEYAEDCAELGIK
ncbi:sugar ABC transporter substrate-binding protein [Nonomuraea lactucae]|uniref:ABC transporter substrate-binding protein n=1 Tax=Nonomuraea lactucae TaxID=2249762 RepID=UPI000DE2D0C8|nr:sugar ABC transporter substrate-binding protein [Nonomuraea lactucae]